VWNIERIARIVAFSIIFYVAFSYVFKRWGEAIRHRIEAIGEWLVDTAEFVRAAYVRIRQVYSPTQLWLLVHLIPLTIINFAGMSNWLYGTHISVRTLFITFAAVTALEAGISMYLMRDWMKRSLLFAAAASIAIFEPWEDSILMTRLCYISILITEIVLLWYPDEILKLIKLELGLPFEEGEFLAKLKTRRGFLLILADSLIRIGKWVTEFIQDWYLQVNLKQVILMPFNLIAVMGVALLLQYPQYPPLEEFAPKAVYMSQLLMLYWAALWFVRWFLQARSRFMSIMKYAQKTGFSTLGGLVTISAIVGLGLTTTAFGIRFVPTVVGEGTAWLYAEALPYFEAVGTVAARIFAALI
jgi:hypothetical protein